MFTCRIIIVCLILTYIHNLWCLLKCDSPLGELQTVVFKKHKKHRFEPFVYSLSNWHKTKAALNFCCIDQTHYTFKTHFRMQQINRKVQLQRNDKNMEENNKWNVLRGLLYLYSCCTEPYNKVCSIEMLRTFKCLLCFKNHFTSFWNHRRSELKGKKWIRMRRLTGRH